MSCLSRAGQSGLPWFVLSAKFGVTIPDNPDPAVALPADGVGGRKVSSPTPTMGSSFSPCSSLELMGANSSYEGSGCTLSHPWGIPHRLAHWDRATFL